MPTTTGMKRGGYYNAHSAPQRVTLVANLPWLEASVADLPRPAEGQTFFRTATQLHYPHGTRTASPTGWCFSYKERTGALSPASRAGSPPLLGAELAVRCRKSSKKIIPN